MNKTFLMSVAIISLTVVITFWLYIGGTRYQIVKGPGLTSLKIDRVSGKSWRLGPWGEEPIQPEVERTPESIAMSLAMTSEIRETWRTVNGTIASEEVLVGSLIQRLHNSNDTLQIIGWKAVKQDAQNFLVSYTINKGDVETGYFFEVNIVAEVVRYIPYFSNLIKKYGLSCDQDGVCAKPISNLESSLGALGAA